MKQFVNPFSEDFIPVWDLWKEYKKLEHRFQYKSSITEQAALARLVELSDGNEATAIAIVKQSIGNGWKGFFELKTVKINGNGNQQANNHTAARQSLNDLYNQRFGQRG